MINWLTSEGSRAAANFQQRALFSDTPGLFISLPSNLFLSFFVYHHDCKKRKAISNSLGVMRRTGLLADLII